MRKDTHIQFFFFYTDIYTDTYLCQLQIYTSANAKCNIRNAIIKKHFITDAVYIMDFIYYRIIRNKTRKEHSFKVDFYTLHIVLHIVGTD